ncbi:MAG: DUF3179 domain-containing protein [Planctomycetes bacterium]|nr:DUF3179 domain-containing protein [Planctomycetota bacterium]
MQWSAILVAAALRQEPPAPEPPLPDTQRRAPAPRRQDRRLGHPPTFVEPREVIGRVAAQRAGIGGDELVIGVQIGDVARAYPIARIALDEVMNDTVDNVAIAVTW